VIIEKREDVLVIPERLITYSADTARVTVGTTGEATEERIIETGLSDGIQIEVVSGLDSGDVVFEKPPREIQ